MTPFILVIFINQNLNFMLCLNFKLLPLIFALQKIYIIHYHRLTLFYLLLKNLLNLFQALNNLNQLLKQLMKVVEKKSKFKE